jgi:hypothetical protein
MLDDKEIELLVTDYMDDLFVEPYKLVLRPKLYSNAIYVILIGKVSSMPNT